MSNPRSFTQIMAAALLLGCSQPAAESKPAQGSQSAAAAQPSAEGLCNEHGVLSAVCPKCNPSLAAVFKAKGDWCAEHGFPESFCPLCHPERGGKPQANVTSTDSAPADGHKVRFKRKDAARLAGLQTVAAVSRPGGRSVLATVRLAYDATKLAHLNARVPGVVRSLSVDIGSVVAKGAALLVIDSPDVGASRARLSAARARVNTAEQNHRRAIELANEKIAPAKQLLAAQLDLEEAKSELGALTASLSFLGAAANSGGGYTLSAPIAGVVTRRSATIGKQVEPQEVLLEIVDTSVLWGELDIAETDLPEVATGQRVALTFDGLPGKELAGTIDYIAPVIDPHTRTATARVSLQNPGGALRAEMFGQARIAVAADTPTVMVPRAAIQRVGEAALAFVRIADDEYETRRVTLGVTDAEQVEITRGLKSGEHVVSVGSFLLKTEILKDSIGSGCCETD